MFVSSYSTYVSTNNSQRVDKQRAGNSKTQGKSFESQLSQSSVLKSKNIQNLPINYISNYKAFSNKQKLQEGFENSTKNEYNKSKAINSAKTAYDDNSKIFSFLIEPKATQSQTPKVNEKLPSELQILQEQNMRHTMVNTYLANDKYYQITA